MKKDGYLMFMSEFYSYVPLLNYGYCITIYKAQGSEWDNVICNISSIEASIVREGAELNTTILTRLFKTTYTALTRARERVICLYLTGN
jgi:ATP-dependent exoDNAse (exonuclease V) alpha subunit